MRISEDQLVRWAGAPSETEEGKCQNAVQSITAAIRSKFGNEVSIFLQGSYKNRTNVRMDSDVDIVVRHNHYYFYDIDRLSEQDKQIFNSKLSPSSYLFSQFRADINQILVNGFGALAIEPKDKCINVKASSSRVSADVVPCFVHKRFKNHSQVSVEGVEFNSSKSNIRTTSFPEQHYDNGVSKNENTGRMYKPVVRILKNIRNKLIDEGKITEDSMPSFFLECLVWNVLPNDCFKKSTYAEATRAIIANVWNDMGNSEKADNYAEVSDLKWLFKGRSDRTYQMARDFMQRAWDFIGYAN